MFEKIEINPNIGEVVSIASNESRLRILIELSTNKQTISKLAKKLGLNVQETHRNIHKMIDAAVIEKDVEGVLNLTTLGKMMMLLFPSFNFVVSNASFFNEHSFDGLPQGFVQRIGALENCRLVVGVVKVLENWVNMINESEKFVKVIASQTPLEPVEITLDKANRGLRVSLIIGNNTILPEKYMELLTKYNIGKLELNGFHETKLIDQVKFFLVITENEASISFARHNGEVDIDKTFFGKDPLFLKWCDDLFKTIWEQRSLSREHLNEFLGIK